jgi:capsular polysaccharide biosynthesis protein
LLEKYGIEESDFSGNDLVYISRSDAKIRKIINETEVFQFLQELGFEKYVLSEMSFKNQIKLFVEARVIIGPHGAAFTNVMFCKGNASLLEIYPKKYYDQGFVMLSAAREVQRDELIEDNQAYKACFRVNMENFKQRVEKILRRDEISVMHEQKGK